MMGGTPMSGGMIGGLGTSGIYSQLAQYQAQMYQRQMQNYTQGYSQVVGLGSQISTLESRYYQALMNLYSGGYSGLSTTSSTGPGILPNGGGGSYLGNGYSNGVLGTGVPTYQNGVINNGTSATPSYR